MSSLDNRQATPRSLLLWTLPILAIGLLTQWIQPFRPGFDDAYAIEAAWRFANGGFMGHSWHDQLADLSQPTLTWLGVDWPPGFALLLAVQLKLGWSIATSVHVIQLAFAVIGIFGWLKVADRALAQPAMVLFAGWVLVVFFANEASVTNLLFWSIVPWVMLHLLRIDADQHWQPALWCGLLAAACLTFRYSSLYLVPACLTWLVLQQSLTWRQRIVSGLCIALPGALVLASLFALNQTLGGAPAFTEHYEKGMYFGAILEDAAPIKAMFANGFGLELILGRLLTRMSETVNYVLATSLFGLMTVGAVYTSRRAPNDATVSVQNKIVIITLCLFTWLLAMLGTLTIRHGSMDGWTFLGHERYYSDLLPAIALCWLFALQPLLRPLRWWKAVIIGIACLAAIAFMTVRHVGGGQRLVATITGQPSHYDIDTVGARINQLVQASDAAMAIVLFDPDTARYPQWGRYVQVRDWPTPEQLKTIDTSQAVRVVAVAPAAEQLSPSRQATIARFGLEPVFSGERGTSDVVVYSATVHPGQLDSE
ncbi:MAG: hypothetical protein DHS20C11_36710 [Lysobacteraceae bacterium]|nr:MAG: hypothetical protein DHS20C11_36710 [Xanthomonadaceae bacterium]